MTTLTTHQFNETDLIVHQDVHGNIWFRGTQICNILGFANSSETLRTHVNDYLQELAIGQGKPALYVAEKGLYILCFRAKTPAALKFQLWAADIIQTIRKTGSYTATSEDSQHFQPFGLTLQLKIKECNQALETVTVGTGKIGKILAEKRALEYAYKTELKAQPTKKAVQEPDPLTDDVLNYCAQKTRPVTLTEIAINVMQIENPENRQKTRVGKILKIAGYQEKVMKDSYSGKTARVWFMPIV